MKMVVEEERAPVKGKEDSWMNELTKQRFTTITLLLLNIYVFILRKKTYEKGGLSFVD